MSSARGQVMLFWDYDTQTGGDRSRTGRKTWGMAEFVNTDRLLDLLAARDIRSTFACVGSAALPGERPYHDPAQIRRIHEAGHEVASHSFEHDWLPGLDAGALRATLVRSREALEQCIGAPVITFVPPWNQPYDYPRVGSISLAERREVRGRPRTDVPQLVEMLHETGYKFARLAYRGALRRGIEAAARREYPRRARIRNLGGVRYVLLNTPAGFDAPAREMVERVVRKGGIAVVWGHPHSLTADNAQNERYFVPFLDWLTDLRDRGLVDVVLPRSFVAPEAPSFGKQYYAETYYAHVPFDDNIVVDYETHWARLGHHFRLAPESRVLDAGCGYGYWTAELAKHFEHVDAFDIAPKAVAVTASRVTPERLWVGEIEKIDAPDEHYDGVFAFGILEHLADSAIGLRELRRVLKPGGRISLLQEFRGENYSRVIRAVGDVLHRTGLRTRQVPRHVDRADLHPSARPPWEWEKLLRREGFDVERRIVLSLLPTLLNPVWPGLRRRYFSVPGITRLDRFLCSLPGAAWLGIGCIFVATKK